MSLSSVEDSCEDEEMDQTKDDDSDDADDDSNVADAVVSPVEAVPAADACLGDSKGL